jgi:hypothetical protein
VLDLIVANEIHVAVIASQFEVPVVGRQPGIEHFRDGDATVTNDERAWRFAAVAGVAFDADVHSFTPPNEAPGLLGPLL